jgi:hypothetical protein
MSHKLVFGLGSDVDQVVSGTVLSMSKASMLLIFLAPGLAPPGKIPARIIGKGDDNKTEFCFIIWVSLLEAHPVTQGIPKGDCSLKLEISPS